MYDMLCQKLQDAGYIHYEVSNFALPDRHSRHNSAYWNDTPYIGLGAAAHSYDGEKRRWNADDLDEYMQGKFEEETLSSEQKEMEHIMLGLRTRDGIALTEELRKKAQPFIDSAHLTIQKDRLVATQSGLHILNRLIEALV